INMFYIFPLKLKDRCKIDHISPLKLMKKYIRKFKRNTSFIIIVKISLFLTGSVVAQSGPGGIGMADGSSPLKLWLDAGNGVYADTLFENKSPDAGKAMLWKDLSGS